ncbi:MAG: hypothetical protein QOE36_1924, partial [Gaiellaceae bacterium]|nr:hypothetical protein [Gaiellaceae bacterium]
LNQDPELAGPAVVAARARPTLPEPPTPLVGREEELEELAALVRDPAIRLVTLSGPGGTGKTRLALEAARLLADEFDDGATLVELAALRDPALVVPAIAQALDVAEAPGEPLAATLRSAFADRRLLLVLDNLEQLLAAAPEISVLLAGCPGLTILATSRAPLRLAAEHELPLPPLDPDAAFALFVERAANGGAAVDSERDRDAVLDVVERLDRLPLAIELAAARAKLLPPRALRDRLGKRLELLRGGARDLPARQQTLRAAIDWSHDLLEPEEQRLFARLAVFAGGFSLETAEEVCDAKLEVLASLVDKSMVRASRLSEEGEARFELLETIREYALERLAASGEEDDLRLRHGEAYAEVVEEFDGRLEGPGQSEAFAALDRDQDNVRAALDFALERGDAELAGRLGSSMGWFWYVRGRLTEGRDRLEAVLALGGPADERRAKMLRRAALIADAHRDVVRARELLDEAIVLRREAGDLLGVGTSLNNLSTTYLNEGDFDRAHELLAESLVLAEQVGDMTGVASATCNLGLVALGRGDAAEAVRRLEAAASTAHVLEHEWGIAVSVSNLGAALVDLGELDRAADALADGMRRYIALGEPTGVGLSFEEIAWYLAERGDAEASARLLGVAAARRAELAVLFGFIENARLARTEARVRELLGDRYEAARAEGESLSPEDAAAMALALLEPAAVPER